MVIYMCCGVLCVLAGVILWEMFCGCVLFVTAYAAGLGFGFEPEIKDAVCVGIEPNPRAENEAEPISAQTM